MKQYIKPELIVEGITTMQIMAGSLDVNQDDGSGDTPKTDTMLSKGCWGLWDEEDDVDY